MYIECSETDRHITNPYEDGHQRRKYADHGVIAERVDGKNREVPQHAWRDRITTSTGRTHRRQKLSVDQKYLARVLQVVPVLVVEKLAQQLDRRLRPVHLSRRHVHVVDEDDGLLAGRRSKVALFSAIHLCHYQELRGHYTIEFVLYGIEKKIPRTQ